MELTANLARLYCPLCRGSDHPARRRGQQGPCLYPNRYEFISLDLTTILRDISSGFQSKELIVKGGLSLGDVDQYPTIDVTIDGADELSLLVSAVWSTLSTLQGQIILTGYLQGRLGFELYQGWRCLSFARKGSGRGRGNVSGPVLSLPMNFHLTLFPALALSSWRITGRRVLCSEQT